MTTNISPRERVKIALAHTEPDRVPVDFLATLEIWQRLVDHLQPDPAPVGPSDYFDPTWEAILRHFEVDCRLLSYDQFCAPPEGVLLPGAEIEWWNVLSRSTPNRMWRQRLPDGTLRDIWGRTIRIVENPSGAYEEQPRWPLGQARSLAEVKAYAWPEPDWWDFSPLPYIVAQLDAHQAYHLRFRIGSVFETAWQMRGMQEFLMELALDPAIPRYIMERLADIYVENTRRVLDLIGDRLDMVYFYDDVATQNSLMISEEMWARYIRPCHARLIEVAKSRNIPVMYHCDGAIYPLIPRLIDLGIDLLNPIQADAKGMDPLRLKQEFGDRLSFHGGIDIIKTLPRGTADEVRHEVNDRARVLGENGGYILASSHHIQSDTPLENVLAMYEVAHRYRTPLNPAGPGRPAQTPVASTGVATKVAVAKSYEAGAGPEVEEWLDELYNAVVDGLRPETETAVQALITHQISPDTILYEAMIPAMEEVGRQFETGACFVPEMLVAAHAMQGGLNILHPLLTQTEVQPVAKIVLGTVKSDIHDIGKNLVGMMFEGAGFEVVDLGVDVPAEKFIEAARSGAQIIGMSALLTTTMVNIPVIIRAMAEAGVRDRVKIIIGGAPITQEFADQAGADGFAANANQAVLVAKQLLGLVQ